MAWCDGVIGLIQILDLFILASSFRPYSSLVSFANSVWASYFRRSYGLPVKATHVSENKIIGSECANLTKLLKYLQLYNMWIKTDV